VGPSADAPSRSSSRWLAAASRFGPRSRPFGCRIAGKENDGTRPFSNRRVPSGPAAPGEAPTPSGLGDHRPARTMTGCRLGRIVAVFGAASRPCSPRVLPASARQPWAAARVWRAIPYTPPSRRSAGGERILERRGASRHLLFPLGGGGAGACRILGRSLLLLIKHRGPSPPTHDRQPRSNPDFEACLRQTAAKPCIFDLYADRGGGTLSGQTCAPGSNGKRQRATAARQTPPE